MADLFAAIDGYECTGNTFIKNPSHFNRKFVSLLQHKVAVHPAHGLNFFFYIVQEPTNSKSALQISSLLHDSCKLLNT